MSRKDKKLSTDKIEDQIDQQKQATEPGLNENEKCKQEIQDENVVWRQVLSGTLEGLKYSPMDSAFDWDAQAKKFKEVPYQDKPETILSLTCSDNDVSPKWRYPNAEATGSQFEKDITSAQYQALASQAAQALGYGTGNDENALQAWEILLILNSPHFEPFEGEISSRMKSGELVKLYGTRGGQIISLCAASADYCLICETEAYKGKQEIEQLRQRKKAESLIQSMESTKPKPPSIESLPSHNGLAFDEPHQCVYIDGIREDLNDEQLVIFRVLWELKGVWKNGAAIHERAARIIYSMSPRVRNEIESHKRQGYRLKRFIL